MLAIARALVRDTKIILLDEPFEGLAPVIVRDLMRACGDLASAAWATSTSSTWRLALTGQVLNLHKPPATKAVGKRDDRPPLRWEAGSFAPLESTSGYYAKFGSGCSGACSSTMSCLMFRTSTPPATTSAASISNPYE